MKLEKEIAPPDMLAGETGECPNSRRNKLLSWPEFSRLLNGFCCLYELFLKLINFPIPGYNWGSHSYLMSVANACRKSRLPINLAYQWIRLAIPTCGSKQIQDFEIQDSLNKAYNYEAVSGKRRHLKLNKKSKPKPRISFDTFCSGWWDADEVLLTKASPVPLAGNASDAPRLLGSCYNPEDFLFAGKQDDGLVLSVFSWIAKLTATLGEIDWLPLIMANPLTGEPGKTKSGTLSYRCDDCVKSFRFAVAEFDELSREQQIVFWAAAIGRGFPVAALIDSGNKSIHGWLAVNCQSRLEWEEQVEQYLFPEILVPLGCDSMCRNESRMSRFPGHIREETGRMQKLLYLNPTVVKL